MDWTSSRTRTNVSRNNSGVPPTGSATDCGTRNAPRRLSSAAARSSSGGAAGDVLEPRRSSSTSASSAIKKARPLSMPPVTTAAAAWNGSNPMARSADSRSPVDSARARCAERSMSSLAAARRASGRAGTGPRSSVPYDLTAMGTAPSWVRRTSIANGLRARFPVQTNTTSSGRRRVSPVPYARVTAADHSATLSRRPVPTRTMSR